MIDLMRILLALAVLPSLLVPSTPPWQGVWQGRLGGRAVRVCLRGPKDVSGEGVGAFYDLAAPRATRLEQVIDHEWIEGRPRHGFRPQPHWSFDHMEAAVLTGRAADGRRFELTRIAGVDGAPCGSAAFNGPRWRPLTITATPARQDGLAYRRLDVEVGPGFGTVGLRTAALPGDDGATGRINADLRARLLGREPAWRTCVTAGLNRDGEDGTFEATIVPTLLTPRWLGVRFSMVGECGAADAEVDSRFWAYDRATGAFVRPGDWLAPDAIADEPTGTRLDPALLRLVIARPDRYLPPDAACRRALARVNRWAIGLDRQGLAFTSRLPDDGTGCLHQTIVPWAVLADRLSPAGREGRASLER